MTLRFTWEAEATACTYLLRHDQGVRDPVSRWSAQPNPKDVPARLRFAYASGQHYEQGYFNAYRHMLADDPELIVFLGDYIHASAAPSDAVRKHSRGEPTSLDDYRVRHALGIVWPLEQQTEARGWRRARVGRVNTEAVTKSDNEQQFTRYSRLRYYLKVHHPESST